MEQHDLSIHDDEYYNEELDSQAEYVIEIGTELVHISKQSDCQKCFSRQIYVHVQYKWRTTSTLECGTFSGKEKDKLAFYAFLTQFNDVIYSKKNHLSNSAK